MLVLLLVIGIILFVVGNYIYSKSFNFEDVGDGMVEYCLSLLHLQSVDCYLICHSA